MMLRHICTAAKPKSRYRPTAKGVLKRVVPELGEVIRAPHRCEPEGERDAFERQARTVVQPPKPTSVAAVLRAWSLTPAP